MLPGNLVGQCAFVETARVWIRWLNSTSYGWLAKPDVLFDLQSHTLNSETVA